MALPQRKPFPIDLRTWIHSTDLNLRGQDKFFSGPGVGPDYDFPNPRGKLFSNELRTFTGSLLLGLLASALPAVTQFSTPNPNSKVFSQDLRTFTNAVEIHLNAAALPNVLEFITPNPLGKTFAQELRTFVNPVEVQLNASALPIVQEFITPNPNGKVYPLDLRTFVNPVELQLAGQDVFFSGAGVGPDYDFPNPQLRKSLFSTLNPLPVNNIVFSIVVYPSTMVFDYPNPRGKQFSNELRSFSNSIEIQLIGKDLFFAAAGEAPKYDFPNPQPKKVSLNHISQLAGNLLGTTLVGGFVPNPYYVLLLNGTTRQA